MTRDEVLKYIQENPWQYDRFTDASRYNPGDSGPAFNDPNYTQEMTNMFSNQQHFFNVPGLGSNIGYDPSNGQITAYGQDYKGGNLGEDDYIEYSGDNLTPTLRHMSDNKNGFDKFITAAAPYIMNAGRAAILGGGISDVFNLGSFGGVGDASSFIGDDFLANGMGSALATDSAAAGAGALSSAGNAAGNFIADDFMANGIGSQLATDAATGAAGAAGAASGTSLSSLGNYDGSSFITDDYMANGIGSKLATDAATGAAGVAGGTTLSSIANSLGGAKGLATLAGTALGGISSATAPKSTTATGTTKLDPRMDSMLYGADGKSGLLNDILAAGTAPQNAGTAAFGNSMSDYLKNFGQDTYNNAQQTANKLMGGSIAAPTMGAASMNAASVADTPGMNSAMANAAQINAPSQNGADLSSAYNKMIYGDSAQNPYLTGAIQKGINQSNNAFGNMLKDQTSATQDLLGNIRGGAIASGQYGGSRQGIAEGKALDSFSTNMSRAASQYGQNNTDAAVAAQAGAYDAGQNRSLSAMGGLGAQQYGVATQNAGFNQQSNLANQSSQNLAAQTNYQGLLNTNLANAGYQQQANQTNSGYQQAANQNNLSSQLSTNTLNSNNQQAGITASQGLLNTANNVATNNDAYNLNKLGTVSGLLSPYTGLNATQSTTTPQFNNTAGSIVGGASTALSLYNMYNKP